MHIDKELSFASSLLAIFAFPALANVTVNSPVNNSDVTSPFSLSANATTCSAQEVTSIGYALDSNADTTIVNGTEIEASVAAAVGPHTVHVEAWGNDGSACDTDVAITVQAGGSGPTAPPSAVSVSSIQTMGKWKGSHDNAGSGASIGQMALVSSPSMSGTARQFMTTFVHNGDERYSVVFAEDALSMNFLYDAWVYFDSTSRMVSNLELDVNQVMTNGDNIIFGFQCAGTSGTWDYTANAGTPQKPKVKWIHSKASCNPRAWSINTWHHVQITYARDDSGNVTYQSVWLDGVEKVINATVPSEFSLHWPPGHLQTQFQVDGTGNGGTSNVYLDNFTIYRW